MAFALFISHSSQDGSLAGSLCAGLEARGLSCWIAPRDVTPGQAYAQECVNGIEESASFLLLASSHAIGSVQVLSEVEQAHKRRKPIFTVLVGKPQVTKELDYYISRLHWIESGTGSTDDLVERLTLVLSGRKEWSDVAAPPSLVRTVRYRRDAFLGSALATVLALGLVGLALGFWIYLQWGKLDSDYRRLGYVDLSVDPAAASSDVPPAVQVAAQVWLLADKVPFRDVRMLTAAEHGDRIPDRAEHSAQFQPEQVGSVQFVSFPIATSTTRLSVCLIVPNAGLNELSRVTQTFSVSERSGTVSLTPVSEPAVSREDGTACASEATP